MSTLDPLSIQLMRVYETNDKEEDEEEELQ
jgi:hypothetical protein